MEKYWFFSGGFGSYKIVTLECLQHCKLAFYQYKIDILVHGNQ